MNVSDVVDALLRQPGRVAGQIAPIGGDRIACESSFDHQMIEIALHHALQPGGRGIPVS